MSNIPAVRDAAKAASGCVRYCQEMLRKAELDKQIRLNLDATSTTSGRISSQDPLCFKVQKPRREGTI